MKVIRTGFAIHALKDSFDYYVQYATPKVANKIRKQILKTEKQLVKNPESGQIEFYLKQLNQNHRYILSDNYEIIYRIINNTVVIPDVFDVRKNPSEMNK